MPTNATNFREYARGRTPGDWRPLFAPEEIWPVRSVDCDPERVSWLAAPATAAREILAWTAADGETTGRADQEALGLFLVPADCLALVLRGGGGAGAENGWLVALLTSTGTLAIRKWAGGAATDSTTAALTGLTPLSLWWVRLRANSSTITARAWLDGTLEPGTWAKTVTDGALADGVLGLARNSAGVSPECLFFSYATNGETAPGPAVIPAGMSTWALDPDAEVEFTAEIEDFDPATDVAEQLVYSTRGRYTNRRDFPSNAEMAPLLADPGSLSVRLVEDLLFGQAEASLAHVQLRNPRSTLDFLLDKTLAGRRLTVRAGLAGWNTHRWFEPVYSGIMEGEPTVEETVDIALQSPYRMLEQNLTARVYIGIPTCVALSGAGHQAPYIAAYDLTRFLLAFRFVAAATPSVDVGIQKASSGTDENFRLCVEAGTGAIVGRASSAGTAGAINLRSPAGINYADGAVHSVAFAADDDQLAYLFVDGVPVAQMVPSGLVDLPASPLVFFGFAGERIFDVRLYGYAPQAEEVQSILSARALGDDPAVVGLWPLDDGSGAAGTDYSSNANNVALAGTVGVNYVWTPTDMGEQDQQGSQMQVVAGAVYNAPALLIDRNRQRFRLNDGVLAGALIVKAKGLVNATWTDGGDGVIEFPTLVSEPVTFDHGPTAEGDDAHLRLAAVTESLMVSRMGLTEATYDPIATRALGALAPYNVAFLAERETRQSDALEALLGGAAAHYRLDRDGRLLPGMLLPPVSPGPIPGEAVLEFLGTAGRSRVAWQGPTADLPNGSFTIAFWVKSFATDRYTILGDDVDAFPSYQAIANNISPDAGGYYVGFYRASPGAIGFRIPWLSGVYFVSPPGMVPWGVWTFVACRFDSATSTLTISAAKQGQQSVNVFTATTSGTKFAAAQGLELGGRLTSASPGSLYGSLAHYQVWTRALTDREVQNLMSAGGVPTEHGDFTWLSFYAPLNEGGGGEAVDQVTGATGRIFGARWAPRMVFDFRRSLSSSALKLKRLRPAWDAIVEWGTNFQPLTDADIAATVTAADRARLKREFRRHHASALEIKEDYRDARELTAKSRLVDLPSASQVAKNLRFRFSPERIQAALTDASRPSLALSPTDEIWVFHPRLRGSQGAALRVAGSSPMLRSLRSALDLWGSRLPSSLRVLDSGEERATDENAQRIIDG